MIMMKLANAMKLPEQRRRPTQGRLLLSRTTVLMTMIIMTTTIMTAEATTFFHDTLKRRHLFRWGARTSTIDTLLSEKKEKSVSILVAHSTRGGSSTADDASTVSTADDNDNDNDNEYATISESPETTTTSTEEEEQQEPSSSSQQQQQLYNFPGVQEGDGSESDVDGIPRRFMKMQKMDRLKAQEALTQTLEWRQQHDVDTILQRPHSKFHICKEVIPHYFAGHDPLGHIIFVQRVGLTNVTFGHANNVTEEELLFHYVYVLEYCWNILEPNKKDNQDDDPTMMNIIDMTGVNLDMLRDTERMSFMKKFVSIMSQNYPSRSYKTLLLNTPRWFNIIYKLVTPLLRESTKAKIEIYSAGEKQNQALANYLGGLDNVPPELLVTVRKNKRKKKEKKEESDVANSTTNTSVGQNSPLEQQLRDFCVTQTTTAGITMQNPVYD